jgi:LuxR family maltose regulon positive regulatory protein
VHVATGELLYEWDDLAAAEDMLTQGMRLAERTGQIGSLVDGCVSLSRLKQAKGDTVGALEGAREAQRLARSSGVGQFIVEAAAWRSWLHLTRGELAAATSEWGEVSVSDDDPAFVREIAHAARARLLLARGEHDEALEMLARMREAAEATGKKGNAIVVLALEALALRAKGENERALSTLARTLALAEPEGYVRTFVDEGPEMAALLSEVLKAQQRGRLATDVPAYYLRRLLAVLERDVSSTTPPGTRLSEPLSERELEVLALLAAGKSNQQIASELFVALSTVKTHVKNIHGKLGVRNRTQAVSRARELELL